MILHSVNGRFAIRDGNWKLLAWRWSGGYSDSQKKADGTPVYAGLPEVQLYDMEKDPRETANLAGQHPEVVSRLMARLEKQVAEGRSTPGAAAHNDVPVKISKP
ncbi:MAG: hypothetical protein GX748_16105 [Lentisphaerae bacterium]|nr:hypothetical protein [Lentisphaerota bacterium]